MLDIRSGSGSTLDELKNQWVTVTTNTNGLDIKTRMYTQSMQLPDGKTLLLSGGWNRDYANLVQQTIAFNGEDLSWQGYANYTESPYGNRQMSVRKQIKSIINYEPVFFILDIAHLQFMFPTMVLGTTVVLKCKSSILFCKYSNR